MPSHVRKQTLKGPLGCHGESLWGFCSLMWMPSLWWLKEIFPSGSPRRMSSDSQAGHKGTPTSRSSKRSAETG